MVGNSHSRLYFGYGSNLWLHQMSLRCHSSVYVGVARLRGYRWIINTRGFANIVHCQEDPSSEVYGLLYRLSSTDEAALDSNEGVPWAYTKELMKVEVWTSTAGQGVGVGRGESSSEQAEVLVYIDRKRTVDDEPNEEYVYRMNKAIQDAVDKGIPQEYVDCVMRRFIPQQSPRGCV
ncbi:MAG: hypothetical protein Q9224_001580 [Gallowayella concinna]